MAKIDFLYFAMLTDPTEGAGTNSPVSLTVGQGPRGAVFHHRFGGTVQLDQEAGQADLYRVDVHSHRIDSIRLSDISIQVGLSGDDQWGPDTLFLWGTAHGHTPLQPPAIVPLAIETGVSDTLSTGGPGTIAATPVRLVRTGGPAMIINRLLLIVTTAPGTDSGSRRDRSSRESGSTADPGAARDSGTDDQIELEIVAGGQPVAQVILPDSSQDDLKPGQANLYTLPVAAPFTRAAMASDAVRLRTRGTDQWLPSALYLFGLNTSSGRPDSIIPLVHIDNWGIVPLSADTTEGTPQAVLPLVPPELEPSDLTGMSDLLGIELAANEDGRLELLALLEDLDDNRVYLWDRRERRGGGWSDWRTFAWLGGGSTPVPLGQLPTVARDITGRLMTAGIDSFEGRGLVTLAFQGRPGEDWQGWFNLPLPAAHSAWACVLGRNGDGQLELFAVDTEGMVWHTSQHRPDATGFAPWRPAEWNSLNPRPAMVTDAPMQHPGWHAGPVVAQNMHGQLELFLVDGGSAVWHWQRREGGWSRWKSLGTPGPQMPDSVSPRLWPSAVARNKHGRLELFVRNGGAVWHSWQVNESDWSAWESMGADPLWVFDEQELTVGAHADGRIVLFTADAGGPADLAGHPGASSKLYHREQTPGGSWSDWEEAPMIAEEHGIHVKLDRLALALNTGKRLELFATIRGTTDLYQLSQTTPSGSQWRGQRVHLPPQPVGSAGSFK